MAWAMWCFQFRHQRMHINICVCHVAGARCEASNAVSYRENIYYCFVCFVWTFARLVLSGGAAIAPSIIILWVLCLRNLALRRISNFNFKFWYMLRWNRNRTHIYSPAPCVNCKWTNGTKLFGCDFHRVLYIIIIIIFSPFASYILSQRSFRIGRAIPHRDGGDPVVIVLFIKLIPYLLRHSCGPNGSERQART